MTALANVASPGASGSGLTDAELRATPVPVSGTVSVTEPVSIDDNGASLTVDGTVAVSNFPATQPVSIAAVVPVNDNGGSLTVDGTFWQATQPVSGTFWQATQPVSGTFWQATQPVSGTVTANPATADGKTLTFVPVAQGAAGTTVLAAASASNKHKVIGCVLVMDAAGTIKFTDSSGDLTGAMSLAANAGFVLPTSNMQYTETGAINRAINIVTVTGKASGVVILLTEP